jgi:hypothetical protein
MLKSSEATWSIPIFFWGFSGFSFSRINFWFKHLDKNRDFCSTKAWGYGNSKPINQSVHCGDDMHLIQSMNGSGGWTDSIKRWWVNVFSSSPQLGTSIKSETSTQMIVLQLTSIFHPPTVCSECSKNVVFVFRENYRKRALNILASGSLMAPCGVTCMPFQYWTLDPQFVYANFNCRWPTMPHVWPGWSLVECLALLDLSDSPVEDGNVCVG